MRFLARLGSSRHGTNRHVPDGGSPFVYVFVAKNARNTKPPTLVSLLPLQDWAPTTIRTSTTVVNRSWRIVASRVARGCVCTSQLEPRNPCHSRQDRPTWGHDVTVPAARTERMIHTNKADCGMAHRLSAFYSTTRRVCTSYSRVRVCACAKDEIGGGKVQGTRALWTQFYPVFCCWILVTTNNRIRNLKPTRSKIHRTHTYTSYCTMTVAKYSTVVKQHHVARPSVRPFRPQGRNLNFTVNTA